MTTTPSLVERLRHGLDGLLHRERDADRERRWIMHEQELRREHDDSVDGPVPGLRGLHPNDFGLRRRH